MPHASRIVSVGRLTSQTRHFGDGWAAVEGDEALADGPEDGPLLLLLARRGSLGRRPFEARARVGLDQIQETSTQIAGWSLRADKAASAPAPLTVRSRV